MLAKVRNGLSIGLVGLPNVGKTYTFNAMTKREAIWENEPFTTSFPNIANVDIKDNRLSKLAMLHNSTYLTKAHYQVRDITGLIKDSHKGKGMDNFFLSDIKNVTGIFHVVRLFEEEEHKYDYGTKDPIKDIKTINYELQVKDR